MPGEGLELLKFCGFNIVSPLEWPEWSDRKNF